MTDLFAGLTRKHYQCVYADPPWAFKTFSGPSVATLGKQPYQTMPLAQIKSLPVKSLAAKDCALFLWATCPMLTHALEVIEAWGFKYKTVGFTWAKIAKTTDANGSPLWHSGTGYWTLSNAELCLLATRGKPKRINRDVKQLVVEPRREHSRKPDRIAGDIERLVPGPYLELFARTTRPGWDVWGNQTDKFAAEAVAL